MATNRQSQGNRRISSRVIGGLRWRKTVGHRTAKPLSSEFKVMKLAVGSNSCSKLCKRDRWRNGLTRRPVGSRDDGVLPFREVGRRVLQDDRQDGLGAPLQETLREDADDHGHGDREADGEYRCQGQASPARTARQGDRRAVAIGVRSFWRVHGQHDSQVGEGADNCGDHGGRGQDVTAGLNRCPDDLELGHEAGRERHACLRQQQHGEGERQDRATARQPAVSAEGMRAGVRIQRSAFGTDDRQHGEAAQSHE